MAVFGVPVVREDDALRAVRAAEELRDGVEIDVRIGVNTGGVVTGTGDTLVTGDAVNVAARLEQAAEPGEVLLGAGTYRLVRDAVDAELLPPLEAKGKAEPLTAYRLRRGDRRRRRRAALRTRRSSAARASGGCSRMPGSARARSARARSSRSSATPGVGKSRLDGRVPGRPRRDGRRAGAASPTARGSRTGRSSRSVKQLLGGAPRAERGDRRAARRGRRRRRTRSRSPSGSCSRRRLRSGRSWSCSTTSSGASRRSST